MIDRRKKIFGEHLLSALSVVRKPLPAAEPWAGRAQRGFEDDDFEGSRNWSIIIIFGAMLLVPLLAVLLMVLI